MKIYCDCGSFISDSTDYISYKAYFISDLDYFDMTNEVREMMSKFIECGKFDEDSQSRFYTDFLRILSANDRVMYQCTNCGKLYVDDIFNQSQIFAPQDSSTDKKILGSVKGSRWKRFLSGDWLSTRDEHKGHLYWQGSGNRDDKESGWETFEDWDALEKRYHEKFQDLAAKNILRDASLKKDYEIIHDWSEAENDANPEIDASRFLN